MQPIAQTDLLKVEKILEMLHGATTPGEAEAASAALTRTLLRLGIDRAEAEQRLGSLPRKDEFVVQNIQTGDSAWKKRLATVCANAMMCSTVYSGWRGGWNSRTVYNRVTVVGRRKDVESATTLYERLRKEVDRLTNTAWKGVDQQALWYVGAAGWKKSYRLGMVAGLSHRISEAAALEAQDGGSALVVVRKEEADEELHRLFPNIRMSRSSQASRVHGDAYNRGKAEAAMASIYSELA